MKKVNPKKVTGYTLADVKKAYDEGLSKGHNEGVRLSMAIFLTVLVDKFNGAEYVKDVWKECENLSDSINRGYVNFWDLVKTLEDEYGIEVGK